MQQLSSRVIVTVTAVLLLVSLLDPVYPRLQLLQHIPTAVAIPLLYVACWRRTFRAKSILCLCGFLILHAIGARYIYSFVPYDAWLEPILGVSLSDHYGWTRNHYDRFVHFAFGTLLSIPIIEHLSRTRALWVSCAAAFAFVMTIGALYEIFEWGLTIFLAPEHAESYNGQQGDSWDAQKDMALQGASSAITGAAWLACSSVRRILRSNR